MSTPQASPRRTFFALHAGRRTLRAARRASRWLIIAILAVSLPMQALSAVVTSMLGARHTHRAEIKLLSVATDLQDSMRGWRDFRRMQYAEAEVHDRAHALGLRHHHQRSNTSVIPDDASAFGNGGASSDTAQTSASFLFMAASSAIQLPPPSETFGTAWGFATSDAVGNVDPWRIERPPQTVAA